MPWLTPDSIPEDDDCRPLSIPASTEWLALVSGALTELTQKWNWEQFGSVSVDDTVARMQQIIDEYYAADCSYCTLPDGERIVRVDDDGILEMLEDGEWVEPTGDYVIPPPEAREGGTSTDQICLAAKNAVNVYHTLYESLSDSWNGALDTAEAVTALIVAANAAFGFVIAPILAGVVAFVGVVFGAVYAALEYIIADLWDSSVDDQFTCFLINCATNEGGVVTFDYDCFMSQLNSLQNDFTLTVDQQRLYGQLMYLMLFTGGVAGLNAAGGTTAITDDDCETCGAWCVTYDLELGDAGLVDSCFVFPSATCGADWVSGQGWLNGLGSTGAGITRFCIVSLDFPSCFITEVILVVEPDGMGSGDACHARITAPLVSGAPTNFQNGSGGDPDPVGVILTLNETCDTLRFTGGSFDVGSGVATGSAALKVITIKGSGDKPSFFDDWEICSPS